MDFAFLKKIETGYEELISKVSKKTLKLGYTYLFVIVYKVLLDFIYCRYIGDLYAFHYIQISEVNVVTGWVVILIMAYFLHLYYMQGTPSAIICIMFNLFYFMPMTTYCGWGGGSSSFLFWGILYWLALTLLQLKIPIVVYESSVCQSRYFKFENKAFYFVVIVVSAMSLYIWGKYANFRILLTLTNVYEVRDEANAYEISTLMQYFIQMSRIVVPMLILLSIKNKRYFTFLWLLFVTLINFSYEGSKTVILFPILLVGGYIFYRKEIINCILPVTILIQVLSIISQIRGNGLLISLIFRRQGVLLVQLSEDYYRFFLSHATDLFRNSIMGKFGFDSIYSLPISKVIGNNYETQTVNCNNGLLSDVWANLGIVGIIVMPIILIICFRLFDMVSYRVDIRLVVSLAMYYAIIFMNTTWSTVLLTHGFLLMCIILVIFPKEGVMQCDKEMYNRND